MENHSVPYIVHEGIMARMERTIKRLWVLAIILLVLLFGTNLGWLYYESQFEEVVVTQSVEQESDRNGNNYNILNTGE